MNDNDTAPLLTEIRDLLKEQNRLIGDIKAMNEESRNATHSMLAARDQARADFLRSDGEMKRNSRISLLVSIAFIAVCSVFLIFYVGPILRQVLHHSGH